MATNWLALADRVQRAGQRVMGLGVSYLPLASAPGAPAFDTTGVWKGTAESVDLETGAPVSSVAPSLTLRLAALPAHLEPEQGDRVTFTDPAWAQLGLLGAAWQVYDALPDGQGAVRLELRRA